MFRAARVPAVTCLVTCLVAVPWVNVRASERQDPGVAQAQPHALSGGFVVPSHYRLESRAPQSVATTNEPKLLLALTAGALIVAGATMLAYASTATCKGRSTTNSCDKKAVVGAMGLAGGTAMLVMWTLSKP